MKIYVLVEDSPIEGYKTEHGLSLMIEYKGKRYLLDAGTTDAFLKNAAAMNVDIEKAQFSVLSHGHYDHSGGYATCFEKYPNLKVYAMESAGGAYYSGSGGVIHYAGVPKEVLTKYEERFCYVNQVTQIADEIYLIPHNTEGLETLGERAKLYKKCGETYLPDDFQHELSFVFDTEKGLIIFNSCSHAGLPVICEEVKKQFPKKEIHAFIGGLHMKGKRDGKEICIFSENEMKDVITYIQDAGIQKIYTGHCTGNVAYAILKEGLGDVLGKLETGKEIEI